MLEFAEKPMDVIARTALSSALSYRDIMQKTFLAGPFASYRHDVTTDIKWGNSQMAHLFRVDPEAARKGVPSSTFAARLVHPDDQDRVLTNLYKALALGGEFHECFRMIDVSGDERMVFSHGCGLKDEASGHQLFMGTLFELSPEDAAKWKAGMDGLVQLSKQIEQARDLALREDGKLQVHLLDMALLEVGQQLARAIKNKLTDWN